MNKIMQKLNELNKKNKLEGYIPINLLTEDEQKQLKKLEKNKFIKISKGKRWIELIDYLEYEGYRTNAVYTLQNREFIILGFCGQKVEIKNKYRIREFAILLDLSSNAKRFYQLSEKWS